MHAAYQGATPELASQLWSVIQVMAVAELAGWIGNRVLDSGIRARGLTLLAGLVGLFIGRWLMGVAGWPTGPTVAGFPLLGAFAGALAVSAVVKLVALGVAGPRW